MSITEMLLYYLPITAVSCVIYASIKRTSLEGLVPIAVRYFVQFTVVVAVCAIVLELVQFLFA